MRSACVQYYGRADRRSSTRSSAKVHFGAGREKRSTKNYEQPHACRTRTRLRRFSNWSPARDADAVRETIFRGQRQSRQMRPYATHCAAETVKCRLPPPQVSEKWCFPTKAPETAERGEWLVGRAVLKDRNWVKGLGLGAGEFSALILNWFISHAPHPAAHPL